VLRVMSQLTLINFIFSHLPSAKFRIFGATKHFIWRSTVH
jgi:hypothetical protein